MDYESFRSTVLLLHANSANFTKVELNKKVKVNFSSHVLSEFEMEPSWESPIISRVTSDGSETRAHINPSTQ